MIHCDRVIVERSGQVVVDRLHLSVQTGESLAVIGRAGAGKSSLLAALATGIPVHGGDASVGGRSVRREAEAVRRIVGYAPAWLTAPPGVRAGEFLGLFAAAAGLSAGRAHAAVAQGLATAGLAGRGDERLDRLPAGRWKLLLLSRALLHGPQVLLFDDPFAGLDPVERRSVERMIDDVRLAGRTVVAAIDDARVPDCFTTLAVLHEGRLLQHGPADPAAIAPGRTWRLRIHCRGTAEEAATAAARLIDRVDPLDAHAIDCWLPPAGPTAADVVAALVRAGIAVTAAGFHPSWTEQLLDDDA
jgi:ABC-2 type transport system ATP-binding protein